MTIDTARRPGSADLTAPGADTRRRNATLTPAPDSGEPALRDLGAIALRLAARPDAWRPLLHVDPDQRWYLRLAAGPGWEAWLLTWLPGQHTDLHDHGGSSGAFTVLEGQLREDVPAPTGADPTRLAARVLPAGQVRRFGARHIHQVTGVGDTAAASLHVYSPALSVMNRYTLDPERGPILTATDRAGSAW